MLAGAVIINALVLSSLLHRSASHRAVEVYRRTRLASPPLTRVEAADVKDLKLAGRGTRARDSWAWSPRGVLHQSLDDARIG